MRRKQPKSLQRKVSRVLTQAFRNWLSSEGDQLLTLNSGKHPEGLRMTFIVSCGLSLGDRKAHRDIQRTFRVGKPTKVPAVVAHEFLTGGSVVKWVEPTVDDILDATEIS